MKCKLGSLVDIKSSKRIYAKEYTDRGIPFYRSKEIIEKYNNKKITQKIFISKKRYHELKEKFGAPAKGDMLLTSVGTLGIPYIVQDEEFYFKDGNLTWFSNFKELYNKYLYYWFHSSDGKSEINKKQIGSTQQALTILDLKNMEIFIPNKKEQIKIVNILSSLDDKIENNNAIIENLEAQAQAIFKSWFVDFEPFQDGEFVDSELGKIPKGWEVSELGNSSLGKLIKSGINDFSNEKTYLATADVEGSRIINYDTKVTMANKPSRANMQPVNQSIWFAKMKDSRKLIFVGENEKLLTENAIFSTGFAGIKATSKSLYYLWTYLLSDEFNNIKDLYCNGTTMQAINNKNIKRIKILLPDINTLKKFNLITKPIYEIITHYEYQNQVLANLRDTLLPKLMSGEIRVGDLDVGEMEKNI